MTGRLAGSGAGAGRLLVAGCAALLAFGSAVPTARADQLEDGGWPLEALRAKEAWQLTRGAGVTVAVIDGGVQADHPDLVGRVLPGTEFGYGARGDGRVDRKTNWHGTAMAVAIAGLADGDGVVGLAPDSRILPISLTQSVLEGGDLTTAIRYGVDHGAKVISISMAGFQTTPEEEAAVRYADAKDVVVVACNGNTGSSNNQPRYPASYPGVVAVGSADRNGRPWFDSVHGRQTVLAGPGVGTLAPSREGGYRFGSGTSQATAYVAAAAALVRARFPHLTAGQVINRLVRTASKGDDGADWEPYAGYGLVNPYKALSADLPAGPPGNPLLTRPNRVPWPSGYAGPAPVQDAPTGWVWPGVLAVLAVVGGIGAAVVVRRRRG